MNAAVANFSATIQGTSMNWKVQESSGACGQQYSLFLIFTD
jgi:hypothetical protein